MVGACCSCGAGKNPELSETRTGRGVQGGNSTSCARARGFKSKPSTSAHKKRKKGRRSRRARKTRPAGWKTKVKLGRGIRAIGDSTRKRLVLLYSIVKMLRERANAARRISNSP